MGDTGKFFLIRSQLNELVLEVKDGLVSHGQCVVTGRAHGGPNQVWYEDTINQCIRSGADEDLCLDIQGDELAVTTFEPDEFYQRWKIQGDKIRHCEEEENVLDVAECCEDEGARVISFGQHGGSNQQWTFDYLPPKYFYIMSKMHGKVIDVKNAELSPGTKLVMWDRKDFDNDNQIFYEDKYGYIHSKLNGFVFDSSDSSICLREYDATISARRWIKSGQKIVQKDDPDTVIDIKRASSSKGAKLCAYEYKASDNQHWSFEYI